MALNKQIDYNSTGVQVSYHKIQSINLNYKESIAEVVFMSYIDEASRLSGKEPFYNSELITVIVNLNEPIIPQIYNYAQNASHCKFIGSLDC